MENVKELLAIVTAINDMESEFEELIPMQESFKIYCDE